MLSGSPFARLNCEPGPCARGRTGPSNARLEGECISGARVSLSIHPVSGRTVESVEIHGTDQSIVLRIPTSPGATTDGRLEHWRGDRMASEFSDRHCDMVERLGVLGETRAFLDAVRTGATFMPSLNECAQQVSLMEALRSRSAGAVGFEPL